MKTITSTVGFQDEAGNLLVNGSIILQLPPGMYLISSGGGQVYGSSIIVNLDATGKVPNGVTIWASDEISPQTPYNVTLCAQAGGLRPVTAASWFIGGTSPIDLSQMIPNATGPSYSGAVLLNPTGQQNINGQTLNLEGASLGLSAAASTTPDTFLNRIGAGIAAIGTAIGNALGTLVTSTIKQPSGSSFALADPLGATHFFISSSSPYTNTFVNGNGTGVVFLGSAAKTSVADTTGNIVTAGTIAVQTAAQTLPASIANDTTGGLNLTSSAGNTVNIGGGGFVNLLTPGAQFTLKGATSGSIGLSAPAVAGSNILTFPAATDTLVGRATTDTLTSKTLGGSGSTNKDTFFNRFRATQGTALTTGDVGSLTGWGSTASVSSVVGTDAAFQVSISCSGTGQALNPTFVVTFKDGTWTNPPVVQITRGEGNTPSAPPFVFSVSATSLQIGGLLSATPVAGTTYSYLVTCTGR